MYASADPAGIMMYKPQAPLPNRPRGFFFVRHVGRAVVHDARRPPPTA